MGDQKPSPGELSLPRVPRLAVPWNHLGICQKCSFPGPPQMGLNQDSHEHAWKLGKCHHLPGD